MRVSILEKNDQAGKQNQELTSRKKQALRTRHKIFKKTMELGTKKGFAALKITDVCKAANISVGTFYHYFTSLDAVFQEQYIAYDEFISKSIREKPLSGASIDQLYQLFSLKYDYVSEKGVQFIVRQYSGQFKQIDNGNTFFYSQERVMYRTLLNILQNGIASGELKAQFPVDFIANSLLIFSRGLTIDWALKNGSYDLKTVAFQHLDMMLSQLVADGEKNPLYSALTANN